MSELQSVIVKNVRERAGRCEEGSSRFVLQKGGENVIAILPIVVGRSGRHYLPSFSTEGAVLDKIMFK